MQNRPISKESSKDTSQETFKIAYAAILEDALRSGDEIATYLSSELPWVWHDAYSTMQERPREIIQYTYETFTYIYDLYQQAHDHHPEDLVLPVEARLVAVIGTSAPRVRSRARDNARLRGLHASTALDQVGPWDRGHFIAHAIGGVVDGNEANVFTQLRSKNRGAYRMLEQYCFKHPGVLCFSRPVYSDTTSHPVEIDFGILKSDDCLEVATLTNRNE